jgi:hypothetical protein
MTTENINNEEENENEDEAYLDHDENLENDDNEGLNSQSTRYGFIHITKTGGTAVFRFLRKHYSEHINTFKGRKPHSVRSDWVPKPILIIREPTERFISIYHYWKYGSDLWHRPKDWNPAVKSIHEFTQKLKSGEPMRLNHSFTWKEHFLPQSAWIKPWNYNKTIVLKYNKDLNNSVQELIKYLDIPVKDIEVPKQNSTSKKEEINLVDDDYIFLRQRYREDYDLWHDVNNNPNKFLKVI